MEDTDELYQLYSSKRQEVACIVRRKSLENKCKLGCVSDIIITDISLKATLRSVKFLK